MTDGAVDLEALSKEIAEIGEKIRALKTATPVDKDAIGAEVGKLNAAKKKYADNNNGIGVDGKPFQAPMSKAEKKKAEKAAKAAAAAAGGDGAPAGGGGGAAPAAAGGGGAPTAANAAKKAAKKAEKAAKKAAMKGGAAPAAAAAAGGGGGGPPAAAKAGGGGKPAGGVPAMGAKAEALQIVVNPNGALTDRPVVALGAAILTNTLLDYTLHSDHRSRQATLGLPDGGGAVVGDFAIARHVVRSAGSEANPYVDAWMDYATSMKRMDPSQKVPAIALTIARACAASTYLVGDAMTLADLAVFAALGFPAQEDVLAADVEPHLPEPARVTAMRWIQMMRSSMVVKETAQLVAGVDGTSEPYGEGLDPIVSGMNLLEGGMPGKVCTRFPPEPSGYLHIGHAKAVLLNDYYARRYNGRLIVRFDDTNPSKEKEEYQQSIVEDLARVGVKPDLVSYTSDYFGTIKEYALFMLEQGLAFMDDTPQEQMQEERRARTESARRNQTPAEGLEFFNLMCSGSKEGSKWCLRAKIDMSSDNGTLRDPVLFRQNTGSPHHRTGTTYKAYPTYDLACPIVDSIEGVSHALRTTEYDARNDQYAWIQRALNLRRVRIQTFSRVNFTHTLLSKRKLTWFVEKGYVTGWNDARFPTVQGVVRRGVDLTALRNFMYSQGASKNVVNMVWHNFDAGNIKEIDKRAKRFMAIDKERHVSLKVTGGPTEAEYAYVKRSVHPKIADLGTRLMRTSDEVALEVADAEEIKEGDEIVLLHWGVVKVTKTGDSMEGTYVPDGDPRPKEKRKLSWLAKVSDTTPIVLTEFDHLVTKDKLTEEDKFEDFINPNTIAETKAIGEAGLKSLAQDDIIQLERRGYYRVDRPYLGPERPLILYMIPDGKSKSMSGQAGKLAHR